MVKGLLANAQREIKIMLLKLNEEKSLLHNNRKLSWIVGFCCVESRTWKQYTWIFNWDLPSVESLIWFLLAYIQKLEEKDIVKEELVSKKRNVDLMIWEILSLSRL